MKTKMILTKTWIGFILLALLQINTYAQNVNVSLSPGNYYAEPLETFSLNIVIGPVNNLMSFATTVNYDPTVVTLVSVLEGNFLRENGAVQTTFLRTIDNSIGQCIIGLTRLTNPPSGVSSTNNNVVLTLNFKANNIGSTAINLTNNGLIHPNGYTTYDPVVTNANVSVTVGPNHSTLLFDPSGYLVFPDDNFDAAVNVASVENLFAVSFDINYNPELLTINSITEGGFLNENGYQTTIFMKDINNEAGKAVVGISRLNTTTGVSTSHEGNLVNINFHAKEPGINTVFLTNVGLLTPDGTTTIPVVSEQFNANIRSFEASVYGQIANSNTGAPVQGAVVKALGFTSPPSNAQGMYWLNLPYGYGYQLTVLSNNFEVKHINDIHVPASSPQANVDIQLTPIPIYYGVVNLIPNPNPAISEVQQGGVMHRHYRVVNTYNGNPLALVPVTVTGPGFSHTYLSDERGLVDISINSHQIGSGQPGTQADFFIVAVYNEALDEPVGFTAKVVHRTYSKYWDAGNYLKLGGNLLGIDLSVKQELGGITTLEVDESLSSFPEDVGIMRQGRAGIGVGFKVKSPGVKGQLGPVSGGIGAEAGVGVSIVGVTEDEYLFPYYTENNYQAVSKYILIGDGNYKRLDNTLIRLLTVCENWFSDGQTMLDAFVSDAVGLEVKVEASASASAGIDVAKNVEIGASANIGVDGNSGFKAKFNYNPPSFEYSFGVSGKFSTSAEAGLSMDFGQEAVLKDFNATFEVWNVESRRGLEFAVLMHPNSLQVEQYRLTLIKKNFVQKVEEKVSYFISGAQAIAAIQNVTSEITQLNNAPFSGSNISVNNNTFQYIITKVFNLLYELQTTQSGEASIYYEIEKTNVTTSSSFDLAIEGSATVLAASFGAGTSFEEGKSMVVENGKWVWGNHLKNQAFSGSIPNVPVTHAQLMQHVISDVPLFLRMLIGAVKWLSFSKRDAKDAIPIDDSGSFIVIPDGALPPGNDSLSVTSWSWFGETPDKRLEEVPVEKRAIYTENKRRGEEDYGMLYGIGGFYQFEPYGLQLLDTCWITIKYEAEEVEEIDETTLGMYWEDKENKEWFYLGGVVDLIERTVTAPITELALFTLAPEMPYGEFGLNALPDSIYADSISFTTITSGPIFNNNLTPVAEGTLFTIGLSHGNIITDDADPSLDGIQVPVENGVLEFQVRSSKVAGIADVHAFSTYGSAHGSTSITFFDTIPPAPPVLVSAIPSNRSVQLKWHANTEKDMAGYMIYYDTDTIPPFSGIHTVYGLPSPITLGLDTIRNIVGLFNDTTYYFAVSAYDVSGNESVLSAFISAKPSEVITTLPLSGVITSEMDTCFSATENIIATDFVVLNGGRITLVAGEKILLKPGTIVESGGYLHAFIDLTETYCLNHVPLIAPEEIGDSNTFHWLNVQHESAKQFYKLFPNPTTGRLTLELNKAIEPDEMTVEIYSMLGERILQTQLDGQQQYEFDLSSRPGGVYLVRIVRGEEVGVEKVVKQ
jgi:hypothetical protein